jgi:hypothetical protein
MEKQGDGHPAQVTDGEPARAVSPPALPAPVPQPPPVANAPPQVRQLYNECLNALFRESYYKRFHSRTVSYAKFFDFTIALGSAASGGTGLGILADPRFGWICGIVTTVAVFLSVAKGVYAWDAKTRFALERVQLYSELDSKYMALVDDVNAACTWNKDFQTRREELRTMSEPKTVDPYGEMSERKRREIQESLKKIVPYTTWWGWIP